MDHSIFDKRRYPIVEVPEGYGEWVRTYEQTVQEEMDLRLLDRLQTVNWSAPLSVIDLACGTGRVGAWLKGHCSAALDGIDITPEMLEVARRRGVYRTLSIADVLNSGLPAETYDLCIQSLADEHLADLRPLYGEVARITKRGGYFVLVGFHPYFLMAGMPTHFDRAPGEPVTIRSYVHLVSDHVKAAHAAGGHFGNWTRDSSTTPGCGGSRNGRDTSGGRLASRWFGGSGSSSLGAAGTGHAELHRSAAKTRKRATCPAFHLPADR